MGLVTGVTRRVTDIYFYERTEGSGLHSTSTTSVPSRDPSRSPLGPAPALPGGEAQGGGLE